MPQSRNVQFSFKLTRDEHAALKEAARSAGMTITRYVRLVLVGTQALAAILEVEPAPTTAGRRAQLEEALEGFRLPKPVPPAAE